MQVAAASKVFTTLYVNSIEDAKQLDEVAIRVELDTSSGERIIEVVHSGEGISQDHGKKIMTAFFSTKKALRLAYQL